MVALAVIWDKYINIDTLALFIIMPVISTL